jgi:hypothetical protein
MDRIRRILAALIAIALAVPTLAVALGWLLVLKLNPGAVIGALALANARLQPPVPAPAQVAPVKPVPPPVPSRAVTDTSPVIVPEDAWVSFGNGNKPN